MRSDLNFFDVITIFRSGIFAQRCKFLLYLGMKIQSVQFSLDQRYVYFVLGGICLLLHVTCISSKRKCTSYSVAVVLK